MLGKIIKGKDVMQCYKEKVTELKKRFGDKTLGEMEEELGINRYNNTGVGFGYLVKGNLPNTKEEAKKILDTSEVDKLLI